MAEIEVEKPGVEEQTLRGPPQACIFVASIATTTTEDKLQEYFSKYGRVLKTKLLKDKAMRPYAFVQFLDPQSADECLTSEDHQLDGRRLRLERAKVNRTLFLAKFSLLMTPPELRKIAEAFGEVESVTIIKHHPSNKSKGCGFVKYQYREDAAEAFTGLKTKFKKWVVEWATSANDPETLGVTKNVVYVGGLPSNSITETILKNHFSTYGEVEDVSVVHPTQTMLKQLQLQQAQQAHFAQLAHVTTSSATPAGSGSHSPLYSPSSAAQAVATSQSSTLPGNANNSTTASPTASSAISTVSSINERSSSPTSHSSTAVAPSVLTPTAGDTQQTSAPPVGSPEMSTPALPLSSEPPSASSPTSDSTASPLTSPKPLTSYAFVTFAEASSAAAAIENENGALFQGETIRVQYCETPDMKMRKKMSKLREAYPNGIIPEGTQYQPGMYAQANPRATSPGISYGYFPSHTAVVTSPVIPGSAVPYWVGQTPAATNTAETPGWYYVQPLQIQIPAKDALTPIDTSSLDAQARSPVSIPLGFPTFLPSPTYAPLGFPTAGQLSPHASPIPLQPFFPLPLHTPSSPPSVSLPPTTDPSASTTQQPH